MSAFDTNVSNNEDVIPEGTNPLEYLVGEGKKFDSPEALAKGKIEADKFIEDLKRQNAELREDMEKSAKLDELMELVRNQSKAPEQPNTSKVDPNDTSSDQMTPEELKAMIENHVSERDRKTTEARNLAEADKVLREKFGDSAGNILNTRAKELGMSVDAMKEMASKTPKAFLRLVGVDTNKPVTPGGIIGNSQRSEGGSITNANTRNSAFYSKMRKESKGIYYSPKIQAQMMKDREALGEAFYGNS